MIKILQGNCIDKLKELDDKSVQCVVTSPPYWGLRDYGTAKWKGGDDNCDHIGSEAKRAPNSKMQGTNNAGLGVGYLHALKTCEKCGAIREDSQIGLEETYQEYVESMVKVFREVKRVLKDDGVVWLNLGDSYVSSRAMGTSDNEIGSYTKPSKKIDIDKTKSKSKKTNLKTKDLVGIPWRVAFALQDDGWYLRQDIIWAKPNPMPESVKDRTTKSHEYIFLLTKSAKYFYDADAIREPVSEISLKRAEYGWDCDRPSTKNASMGGEGIHTKKMGNRFVNPNGRNKRSVWRITTRPYKEAHFATFPTEIPEICIKAGSKPGDVVLDPFAGAGTTGLVATRLNRDALLIELNPEYIKLIEKRVREDAPMLNKVEIQ